MSGDLHSVDGLLAGLVDQAAVADGGALARGSGNSQEGRVSVVGREQSSRLRDTLANVVGESGELVPVAPGVGVARADGKTAVDGLGDVELRAQTSEDGLNGPLELGQELVASRGVEGDLLEAVHADEREADALDVDIVDLGVDEDVVDVQLDGVDVLGGVHGRVGDKDGLLGDPAAVASDTSTSSSTGGVVETLNGELEEQVAGGGEDDVGLLVDLDGDETLAVGDRDGRNAQAGILVEPEEQRNPHVESGLLSLGGLSTVNNVRKLASGVGSGDGGNGGGSTGDGQAESLSGRPRRALDGAQIGVSVNGDFLADEALPAGELAGSNAELLVEQHGLSGVLVEGIAVNLELDVGEEALTRVLAVADEVLLVGARVSAVNERAVLLDVVVGVLDVGVARVVVGGGRDGGSARGRLVSSTNVAGEGRDRGVGGRSAGDGVEDGVDNHVVEEVTELRDRELHSAAELSLAGVGADLVVLVADRSEGLEVGVDEENVGALDVHQSGGGVGEALLVAHAHDILDALVEELGGHDHAIGLTVVGDEFEDTSCGHVLLSVESRVYGYITTRRNKKKIIKNKCIN